MISQPRSVRKVDQVSDTVARHLKREIIAAWLRRFRRILMKELAMEQRLDFLSTTPNVVKEMLGLHKPLSQSGLETRLLDLVYFRVSQINGCAYCLDMHSKDLRAAGETEQRLYGSKRGARARSIRSVNVRHSLGQRLSRHSAAKMFPTMSTSRRAHNSAKQSW